jgi:hypothetical protein
VWSLDGVETVKRSKSKKLQRLSDGQIEEITIDLSPSNLRLQEIDRSHLPQLDEWEERFKRLVFTQQLNGHKPAWIGYRLAEMNPPIEVWQMAEKYLGYKRGWAVHRWRECQEVAA